MSGLRVRMRGDMSRYGTEGLAQVKHGRTPPVIISGGHEVIADVGPGGIAHVIQAVTERMRPRMLDQVEFSTLRPQT